MARNKLSDLNDHLFEQLERLNDEDLTEEQISKEVKRSSAMTKIASHIIKNAKVTIDAMRLVSSGAFDKDDLPKSLGIGEKNER